MWDWLKRLFRRKKKSEAKIKRTEMDRLLTMLRLKGMAGRPVICTCGNVYSNRWGYCLECGERKDNLPPKSFPIAKGSRFTKILSSKGRDNGI